MYRKTVLKSGVRLITERIPHVRSVSMGIWVTSGSRDESGPEAGISHFIEHMVFKGTSRRDAQQIAREIDSIGGASNAFTSRETTCFHARALGEHLPLMIDILADIFLESTYERREIERERHVVLQEIGLAQDTPDEYVHDLLGQSMWGDHPLGGSILGTADSVRAIGRRQIKGYLKRAYGPRSILIAAAGNLDHQALRRLIEPLFGALPANGEARPREVPQAQARLAVFGRELEQVHLCLGLQGPAAAAPERYAVALLNIVLGGSMSSRLFQTVREKMGLAYSIYSFQAAYVDAGMLGVYAGVDPRQVAKTLRLIGREMKRLKRELIGKAELKAAKEHLRGSILLSAENTDNRMSRLAKNEINFGRFLPYDEIIAAMEAVKAREVRELANRLFQDECLSLVTLGPVEEEELPGEALKLN
jgi:predicted Zn-dependent peptidase